MNHSASSKVAFEEIKKILDPKEYFKGKHFEYQEWFYYACCQAQIMYKNSILTQEEIASVMELCLEFSRTGPEGYYMNKKYADCKQCGNPIIRLDKHDAYACRTCNVWIEKHCSDSDCKECNSRPKTPVDCDWEDPNNGHVLTKRLQWYYES